MRLFSKKKEKEKKKDTGEVLAQNKGEHIDWFESIYGEIIHISKIKLRQALTLNGIRSRFNVHVKTQFGYKLSIRNNSKTHYLAQDWVDFINERIEKRKSNHDIDNV